jgi:hypothetical protein
MVSITGIVFFIGVGKARRLKMAPVIWSLLGKMPVTGMDRGLRPEGYED